MPPKVWSIGGVVIVAPWDLKISAARKYDGFWGWRRGGGGGEASAGRVRREVTSRRLLVTVVCWKGLMDI